MRRYSSALAPGSMVAISHTTKDGQPAAAQVREVLAKTPTPIFHRSRQDVEALFEGLDLVPPGVVWTPQWYPDGDTEILYATPEKSAIYAGVAQIPG